MYSFCWLVKKYDQNNNNNWAVDPDSWAITIAHAIISSTFIVYVIALDIAALIFRDLTPEYHSESYNRLLFRYPGVLLCWDILAAIIIATLIIIALVLHYCANRAATAPKNAEVEAPGDVDVEAPGDAEVEAPGDAEVEAPGDAEVEAPGDAEVEAPGDVDVKAPVDAEVEAPGDVDVKAPGDADVAAPGDAEVEAPGDVDVKAPVDAEVEAPGDVDVKAPVDAEVEAPVDVDVKAPGDADVAAPGDAEVEAPGDAEVEAPGDAEIEAPEDVDVKAPVDAEVEAPRDVDVKAPRDADVAASKVTIAKCCPAISKCCQAMCCRTDGDKYTFLFLKLAGVVPLLSLASHAHYILIAWITDPLYATGIKINYVIFYVIHLLVLKQSCKSYDLLVKCKSGCKALFGCIAVLAVFAVWLVSLSLQVLVTAFFVYIPINYSIEDTPSKLLTIIQGAVVLIVGLIAWKVIVDPRGKEPLAIISGALRKVIKRKGSKRELKSGSDWVTLDDEEKLAEVFHHVIEVK